MKGKRKVGSTRSSLYQGLERGSKGPFIHIGYTSFWSISQTVAVLETRNQRGYGNKIGRAYLRRRIRLNELCIRRYIPLGSMFAIGQTQTQRDSVVGFEMCIPRSSGIFEKLPNTTQLIP